MKKRNNHIYPYDPFLEYKSRISKPSPNLFYTYAYGDRQIRMYWDREEDKEYHVLIDFKNWLKFSSTSRVIKHLTPDTYKKVFIGSKGLTYVVDIKGMEQLLELYKHKPEAEEIRKWVMRSDDTNDDIPYEDGVLPNSNSYDPSFDKTCPSIVLVRDALHNMITDFGDAVLKIANHLDEFVNEICSKQLELVKMLEDSVKK